MFPAEKGTLTHVRARNNENLQISKRKKLSASQELFNFPMISAGLMRGQKEKDIANVCKWMSRSEGGLVSLSHSRLILLHPPLLFNGKT